MYPKLIAFELHQEGRHGGQSDPLDQSPEAASINTQNKHSQHM